MNKNMLKNKKSLILLLLIILILITFLAYKITGRKIIYDPVSQNVDTLNISPVKYSHFDPEKCNSGVIARFFGINSENQSLYDYLCRPRMLLKIRQGIFGHTTAYETQNCSTKSNIPEEFWCGTSFIGTKIYVAIFDKNKTELQIIKTLETTKENNGFFETELPAGTYFVFSECNKYVFDYAKNNVKWYSEHYNSTEKAIEELDIAEFRIIITKNVVREVSHGINCIPQLI